jgi:hypothetical protein
MAFPCVDSPFARNRAPGPTVRTIFLSAEPALGKREAQVPRVSWG